MNWANELYDLYEKNAGLVGKSVAEEKAVLLPMSHATAQAQIEVTISGNGIFEDAKVVDKADATTVIPGTEQSLNRTSGAAPHPLCDSLEYLAGDYSNFVVNDKAKSKAEKGKATKYDLYIQALEKWCASEFAHPKAQAILEYLKKGHLMRDLVHAQVLVTDSTGELQDGAKIQNLPQENAFVRFQVRSSQDDDEPRVWMNAELQQSFIDYYSTCQEQQGLCYLTGKQTTVTELHPRKIRNEGDQAKLLSSNDETNFTFRGRFKEKEQAFSIGYEASQKIHNALKWIIRKQGESRYGLCVVSWESDMKPFPKAYASAVELVQAQGAGDAPETELDSDEDPLDYDESESAQISDTNYVTAMAFNQALQGYKTNLSNTSRMVVMSLDSATPGRLTITYFRELETSEYLENIQYWHESCCWLHSYVKDKKRHSFEGMASLFDCAKTLFGTESSMGTLDLGAKGKDSPMLKAVFAHLLPCILERKRIPLDFVRLAAQRASAPQRFKWYNWEKILAVACSMIRKHYLDTKKEDWKMALNTQSTNRSYLFGRLLAVADKVERSTFDKSDGDRQTNAMRYMTVFSQRPAKIWQIIEKNLLPYLKKLKPGRRVYYSKLMDEISSMFSEGDFSSKDKLDERYLLGFHCQRFAMSQKKNNDTNNEVSNDTQE